MYPKLKRSDGQSHTFIQDNGHYVTVTTEQIEHMLSQVQQSKPRSKKKAKKAARVSA